MSNESEPQQSAGRKPDLHAFQTREGETKDYFNRVGAAWKHKDGNGYTLQLDSLPLDGRVVLRTPQERVEEMKESARDDREDRRGERRSSGREDRRTRDAGPSYER